MQKRNLSVTERFSEWILNWLRENRLVFLAALVFGLITHMFVMTNKLPNHDDVVYLFSKGETIYSGRWGLELLRLVIPDYSMPWLHGIVSLLLLSVSVVIIINLFHISSSLSRILLCGLIISFPSQIGTFCYMYTSSAYAVAFFLSVLAVREARQKDWRHWLLSSFLIVLMFSIYQAYLAITASLMVLLLIQDILESRDKQAALAIFRRGLLYICILVLGLELYRLTISLSLYIAGGNVNQYSNEAQSNGPGFPSGIAVAYRFFLLNLTSRYNMIIVSRFSRILHFICLGGGLACILLNTLRKKSASIFFLLLFCLSVLPFSICILYAAFYWNTIHTLVLYSFIALYLLIIIGLEQFSYSSAGSRIMKDLIHICLFAIMVINICFANRTYLKLHLEYENAYSLATTLVTQIRSVPDYDETDQIVLYPSAGEALHFDAAFGDPESQAHDLMGVQFQLLTGYTEADFIYRYIGAEMNIVDHKTAEYMISDRDFERMPVYPADGSIHRVDEDTIFVKFAP